MKRNALIMLLIMLVSINFLHSKKLIEQGSFAIDTFSDFEFEGNIGVITTVDDITTHPDKYFGGQKKEGVTRFVYLVGAFVSHIEDNQEYVIEDSWGGFLNVFTAQRPETKTKYNIYGSISIYPGSTNQMVLHEVIRHQYYADSDEQWKNSPEYVISGGASGEPIDPVENTVPNGVEEGSIDSDDVENEIVQIIPREDRPEIVPIPPNRGNLIIYIALGLMLLVIIILAIVMIIKSGRKSKPNYGMPTPEEYQRTGGFSGGAPPVIKSEDVAGETIQTSSGNTMRWIEKDATTKFIPGKFVVVSERDQGTEFRMGGYPTPKGNVVTLGRTPFKEIDSSRRQSHIEIDSKFSSVSRKQLEIRERNGELFVKNLSSTNKTKLNGMGLSGNEEAPLKNNDSLIMGELEIKYVL